MAEETTALAALLQRYREESGSFSEGEPRDITSRTYDGDPLLVVAIYRGVLDEVRTLLAAGVDVNERAEFGQTPLQVAVHTNRTDIVDTLLGAGADISLEDERGKTALDIANTPGREAVLKLLTTPI